MIFSIAYIKIVFLNLSFRAVRLSLKTV